MKNAALLIMIAFVAFSCRENKEAEDSETLENEQREAVEDRSLTENSSLFGEDFRNLKVLSASEMGDIYKNLKPGDTVNVTFKGAVESVCQAKGCWMQIDLGSTEAVMVKFKDYGFFVPKDIADKEVEIHGVAFISEVPVEEQRHYAEDAGKSASEIAAITLPKRSLGFTAEGVKIPK